MAVVDKGKQIALDKIAIESTQIRLYGRFGPNFVAEVTNDEETFTFDVTQEQNEYAREVNGVWTILQTSAITFEIDATFLDGEAFRVDGIEILDDNDNVIVRKALASPVTYNDPGEFIVESYTLTIPN
jgi:hypothetical protein